MIAHKVSRLPPIHPQDKIVSLSLFSKLSFVMICPAILLVTNFVGAQTINPPIARIGASHSNPNPAAMADTLVLCPPDFAKALGPWIEYRQSQGHLIYVEPPANNAYGIRRQVRRVAEFGRLTNLLIIGDTPVRRQPDNRSSVATDYIRAQVVSQYGSEPEIASDNTFADWNDDGIPDLAIGRIPVDTTQQLSEQIQKIIRYESLSNAGGWKRRINFVAGTGGFGPVSDEVIEKTSKQFIAELIPAEFNTTVTYASWSSAYCPDPRRFVETTVARLNEGCLFWVYMGHGHPRRLDFVRTPIGGYPIFQQRDLTKVNCAGGMPVAIMLACYTGAFDMPQDCLGEQLVRLPQGPIAVLGGTRVTTPYGMSILSLGLLEEYFDGEPSTLGEIFLNAKQRLVQFQRESPVGTNQVHVDYRQKIEVLGKALSPTADQLDQERFEHLHLFHLLGDPLLKLPHPNELTLSVTDEAVSGQSLVITGHAPHAGRLLVDLCYSRDRMLKRRPRRQEFLADPEALAEYQTVYQQANHKTCAHTTIPVTAGPFETHLEIPAWASGRCVVRAYLDDGQQFAAGSHPLRIKKR